MLVRHSEPIVDPALPASGWPLSDRGAAMASQLAEMLRPYVPGLVVTSTERKAIETGRIIADLLDLPTGIDEDLNEQGGGTVPFIQDRAAFLDLVREHFHRPGDPVLGEEPATIAADRLAGAVARHVHVRLDPPILVTHGRIMATYLARLSGQEPWAIWEALAMPDAYLADPVPPGSIRHIDGLLPRQAP